VELLASDTSSFEGGPPFSAEPQRVGNFDERQWGISVSAVTLDKETAPVVKHFLIPASVLVSPNHHWSPDKVVDDETYQVTFPELTDSEFVAHRTNRAIWPVHS
jgi:hypothetical protein